MKHFYGIVTTLRYVERVIVRANDTEKAEEKLKEYARGAHSYYLLQPLAEFEKYPDIILLEKENL